MLALPLPQTSHAASRSLRAVASATGRSYSSPVYKADGRTVDDEASRRVESQFRLKDEEMIREMIEILSSEQNQ